MNFYKRHVGDYLRDTAHLSLLEHGIYTRLLDVYYTRECAIPEDQAARLIGARSKDEREAVERVLEEFFTLQSHGWVQSRCEREIEVASAKAERNREVGKLGGRPRTKPEKREPTGNPDGFQKVATENPSQTPDTRLQKPEQAEQKESRARRARAPSKTPLPDGFGISDRVQAWAGERGYARLPEHLDHFVSKAKARGYVYADWDEALMGAIRDDWAGLQSTPSHGGRGARESVSDFNRRSTEEALALLGNGRTVDA
ncbi:MAG: YdaU family protein [Sulfuricaulis sp.]|nr:YdaU family protein [Sulfuricaulis sp.]